MKLKAMAALCRRGKRVTLFERRHEDGTIEQFLSDGFGVYMTGELPQLDEESVLAIFDVSAKDDWTVQRSTLPDWISTDDFDPTDEPVRLCGTGVTHEGKTYRPLFRKGGGVVWTDEAFFSPIADSDFSLFLRGSERYLVAKAGMFFLAALTPVTLPVKAKEDLKKSILGGDIDEA